MQSITITRNHNSGFQRNSYNGEAYIQPFLAAGIPGPGAKEGLSHSLDSFTESPQSPEFIKIRIQNRQKAEKFSKITRILYKTLRYRRMAQIETPQGPISIRFVARTSQVNWHMAIYKRWINGTPVYSLFVVL